MRDRSVGKRNAAPVTDSPDPTPLLSLGPTSHNGVGSQDTTLPLAGARPLPSYLTILLLYSP